MSTNTYSFVYKVTLNSEERTCTCNTIDARYFANRLVEIGCIIVRTTGFDMIHIHRTDKDYR